MKPKTFLAAALGAFAVVIIIGLIYDTGVLIEPNLENLRLAVMLFSFHVCIQYVIVPKIQFERNLRWALYLDTIVVFLTALAALSYIMESPAYVIAVLLGGYCIWAALTNWRSSAFIYRGNI